MIDSLIWSSDVCSTSCTIPIFIVSPSLLPEFPQPVITTDIIDTIISSTITIMLLLRCGQIMNIGYEKVLLMQNSLNQASSDVISTYVYRVGILEGNFDYSTAISLFNSVCNILLLLIANAIAKRGNGTSLW